MAQGRARRGHIQQRCDPPQHRLAGSSTTFTASMWWRCWRCVAPTTPTAGVAYGGPFRDRRSFDKHRKREPLSVAASEFSSWSDDASFPQLPADDRALGVFRKLRESPRLVGRSDGRSVGRTDGRTDHSPVCSLAGGERFRSRNCTPQPTSTGFILDAGESARSRATSTPPADKHRLILDGGRSARSASSTPPMTSTSSSSTQDTPQ